MTQTVSLLDYQLTEDVNVRIEAGVQSSNSQWFISLNKLFITLGKTFCQSLPGYPAFNNLLLYIFIYMHMYFSFFL